MLLIILSISVCNVFRMMLLLLDTPLLSGTSEPQCTIILIPACLMHDLNAQDIGQLQIHCNGSLYLTNIQGIYVDQIKSDGPNLQYLEHFFLLVVVLTSVE